MPTTGHRLVVIHPVRWPVVGIAELRQRPKQLHAKAGLLADLAKGRILRRLPRLHGALREAPDRLVRFPEQEDLAAAIHHGRAARSDRAGRPAVPRRSAPDSRTRSTGESHGLPKVAAKRRFQTAV